MRADYVRFVDLANEGARELGDADLGAMWRSNYDMSPDEFTKEAARLWEQVKPLYVSLHCYVRGKLQKTYGAERVPDGKAIPAQLLGNMWAQRWDEIYPLVEPYPGVSDLNVTSALAQQKYDPIRITQSAESFYVSLGFPKLPQTFWERSLLSKPADRDVHQPFLFQGAAQDGFHEAIGDTVNLSMTPAYLHQIGLLGPAQGSPEATINQQMKLALNKIAFLPFGKLIDEWRWQVFAGEVKPESYNAAWWQLREQYQGVAAPVPRSEADFDPGAKYHVPANVPYTRYFLSFILQFQLHKALCEAAGHQGCCTSARFTEVKKLAGASARCLRWDGVSPGRTRWKNSRERDRWTRLRSRSTSPRCGRGWKNRTRVSSAVGEPARPLHSGS